MKQGGSYIQDEKGNITLVERTSYEEDKQQKPASLKVVSTGRGKSGQQDGSGKDSETQQESNS